VGNKVPKGKKKHRSTSSAIKPALSYYIYGLGLIKPDLFVLILLRKSKLRLSLTVIAPARLRKANAGVSLQYSRARLKGGSLASHRSAVSSALNIVHCTGRTKALSRKAN
jgi:hypothetical protein